MIEYEDAPEAWQVSPYQGDLYNRNKTCPMEIELLDVTMSGEDASVGTAQIDLLTSGQSSRIKLRSGCGPLQCRLRHAGGGIAEWTPSIFDRAETIQSSS